MLLRTLFFLALIVITPSSSYSQSISDFIKAVGDHTRLEELSSFTMSGKLKIQDLDLTIPFTIKNDFDKGYLFIQEKVEKGMDVIPELRRGINNNGAFLQVGSLNGGNEYDTQYLSKEAFDLWSLSESLFPFDLYLASEKGFKLINDSDGITITNGKDEVRFSFSKDLRISSVQFDTYHIQFGRVTVERKILEYSTEEGISYPSKWIDNRMGTQIEYIVKSVSFNNEIPDIDFLIPPNEVNTSSGEPSLNKPSIKTKEEVINKYINALNLESPFTESNKKIEDSLKGFLKEGRYTNVKTDNEFAKQLSDDIIAITGDLHFGIEYNPDLFENILQQNTEEEYSDFENEIILKQRKHNFFFQKAEKLGNGAFYLKITEFALLEPAKSFLDSLMNEVAVSKYLIIDLRGNSGGAEGIGRYLSSYLLPRDTHLYTLVTKREEIEIKSMDVPVSPWLKKIPVYVLVDGQTVSAGEQLAYLLQNHERAIIIGEQTVGAAHGSIDLPLSDGFVGFVPIAYEVHKKTGTDWEGTGVKPDVEVRTNQSLDEILEVVNRLKKR